MRKSKFNESQIVGILKEAEAGVPIADAELDVRAEYQIVYPSPELSVRADQHELRV